MSNQLVATELKAQAIILSLGLVPYTYLVHPSYGRAQTVFYPNSSDSPSCATVPSTQTIASPFEPFSLPLFEVSCETKAAQHHTRLFRTMPEGEVVVVRATLHNIMGIPFIKE